MIHCTSCLLFVIAFCCIISLGDTSHFLSMHFIRNGREVLAKKRNSNRVPNAEGHTSILSHIVHSAVLYLFRCG